VRAPHPLGVVVGTPSIKNL